MPARANNWGRWGKDDERGTLNLLTPELVKKAAHLVKTGKVYSLAVPLAKDGPIVTSRHKTWHVMCSYTNEEFEGGRGSADDILFMHTHGTTHIDALSHYWYDGKMFNGWPGAEVNMIEGAKRNAIHNVRGIVGRGVLLDIARFKGVRHLQKFEPVHAADLEACAKAQGVAIQPGDILLVRTGWYQLFNENRALHDSGYPGLDGDCGDWLGQHDIVAAGADNAAVEVYPLPVQGRLPVHKKMLRDWGGYLLEYLDLEELARDKTYECLFMAAPLRIMNGVGSPLNPLAIA